MSYPTAPNFGRIAWFSQQIERLGNDENATEEEKDLANNGYQAAWENQETIAKECYVQLANLLTKRASAKRIAAKGEKKETHIEKLIIKPVPLRRKKPEEIKQEIIEKKVDEMVVAPKRPRVEDPEVERILAEYGARSNPIVISDDEKEEEMIIVVDGTPIKN